MFCITSRSYKSSSGQYQAFFCSTHFLARTLHIQRLYNARFHAALRGSCPVFTLAQDRRIASRSARSSSTRQTCLPSIDPRPVSGNSPWDWRRRERRRSTPTPQSCPVHRRGSRAATRGQEYRRRHQIEMRLASGCWTRSLRALVSRLQMKPFTKQGWGSSYPRIVLYTLLDNGPHRQFALVHHLVQR